jgi:HSP20 family protein
MLRNPMTWMNPFNELRREMDRLLDGFGLGAARPALRYRAAYPALNVWNEGEALCVEAEVPGIRKEDLEIFAVGNELTIKGRRPPLEGEKLTYHRRERGTGEFTRVITLPDGVDADKVEAVLKDGVLTVRLPKAESAKPRQIAIKTS